MDFTSFENYYKLPAGTVTALQTAQGTTFTQHMNEFLSKVIDKIAYTMVHTVQFTNPFAQFWGKPIEYGNTIENLFVELPDSEDFDGSPTEPENPFKQKRPTVDAYYTSINWRKRYKVTVSDEMIRRAVKSPETLGSLVAGIIEGLTTKMNIDKYYGAITVLDNANNYAKGVENLNYSANATDEDKAKLLVGAIVGCKSHFTKPNKVNNKAGVDAITNVSDIVVVIKSDLLNTINMEYLAGIFNLDKIEMQARIIDIETFQVDKSSTSSPSLTTDIDMVVFDRNALDFHPALQVSERLRNPEKLYTNYYLHSWDLLSFKLFKNARAYKLKQAN